MEYPEIVNFIKKTKFPNFFQQVGMMNKKRKLILIRKLLKSKTQNGDINKLPEGGLLEDKEDEGHTFSPVGKYQGVTVP